MVMELDLNVTDPTVNRRDVESMIPVFCWMYLKYHSFQLNSTVFVNRTTFGIKVCSSCRELKLPRRLATAVKTTLKNKHLRKGDYFAIIAFCAHSILLTNNAKTGPVVAPYN